MFLTKIHEAGGGRLCLHDYANGSVVRLPVYVLEFSPKTAYIIPYCGKVHIICVSTVSSWGIDNYTVTKYGLINEDTNKPAPALYCAEYYLLQGHKIEGDGTAQYLIAQSRVYIEVKIADGRLSYNCTPHHRSYIVYPECPYDDQRGMFCALVRGELDDSYSATLEWLDENLNSVDALQHVELDVVVSLVISDGMLHYTTTLDDSVYTIDLRTGEKAYVYRDEDFDRILVCLHIAYTTEHVYMVRMENLMDGVLVKYVHYTRGVGYRAWPQVDMV